MHDDHDAPHLQFNLEDEMWPQDAIQEWKCQFAAVSPQCCSQQPLRKVAQWLVRKIAMEGSHINPKTLPLNPVHCHSGVSTTRSYQFNSNLCIWRISTTLGRNLSFHSSTIEVILQADIWTGILNCTLNNQCWAKLFHSPKKPAIERVTFGHRKNLKIFPFTIVSAMPVFSQ
jgi:hypothetical protein